jgi:hypothetical protein
MFTPDIIITLVTAKQEQRSFRVRLGPLLSSTELLERKELPLIFLERRKPSFARSREWSGEEGVRTGS